MTTPLERLRHHVSGAIARGEATAIEGRPATREGFEAEATELKPGRWAVHPKGALGTCGWIAGKAWAVRYVNARNASEAIRKATR